MPIVLFLGCDRHRTLLELFRPNCLNSANLRQQKLNVGHRFRSHSPAQVDLPWSSWSHKPVTYTKVVW